MRNRNYEGGKQTLTLFAIVVLLALQGCTSDGTSSQRGDNAGGGMSAAGAGGTGGAESQGGKGGEADVPGGTSVAHGGAGGKNTATGGNVGAGGSAGRTSSPDAGTTPDAGKTGDTAAAIASRCFGGGLVFCDGFEGDAINPDWWNPVVNANVNTIRVEKAQHARGSGALHVHIEGSTKSAWAHLVQKTVNPALTEHYFARFFLYATTVLPGPAHSWFIGERSAQLGMQSHKWRLYAWAIGKGENAQSPPGALVSNRWVCLEWEVNTTAGTLKLWQDDVELLSMKPGALDRQNMNKTFGLDVFVLGPENAFATTDLWLDELAMDTSRIGCAR